ncbi:OmpH family outer membrane protein [Utexia brackfieldae]|uniref:OmpH family outer membrane protein n=1 Tax=Utexia brackfieldae TaxID=3074108 RepID=UPI00370DD215
MKKILCILSLTALLLSGFAYADGQKIAVIDVIYILQNMPEREAISKALDSEFEARAKVLQTEEQKTNEAASRLQKEGLTLSAAQKKKLADQINAFETKAKAFSQDYRKREGEEANKLLVRIKDVVTQIVKKDNYSLVLKAEAAFYADNSTDITAQVLEQVKK